MSAAKLKAKVVMIGPEKSGKSQLANFLSDAVLTTESATYLPTRGCRILEFDIEDPSDRLSQIAVQLWDISGNPNYENIWPALAQDTHGAIVVFDLNKPGQEENLTPWFKTFVKRAGLRSAQCVVFANNPTAESPLRKEVIIDGPLSKARLYYTDINERPDDVRGAFSELLEGVKELVLMRREKEENKMFSM